MESASIIGRGTVVRGGVRGEGDLEILGRVEGSVAVGGDLSIGESALVKSDVSARRVTVHGAVAGNVSATEAIVLEPGARVVGDLGAPQIGIRPGALVRGMVSTHGPLAAGASPAAAARAQKPAPARPAPAARPAPKPVAAPARPAPPAPRRTETPTLASARVEPVEAAPPEAEPERAIRPPPPVVPQIRKGAKASLRRKAGR